MRRLIALAGAAVGLPVSGCSAPAPTAHRADRTDQTAVTAPTVAPDSRPGSDDASDTSTTGPAPTTTTEAPTTTAHVVTVPTDPPTTIVVRPRPLPVTTLPERVLDDLDDEAWTDRERILACIRSHEGAYATNTGNGYFGAYQFLQGTWDSAAAKAGYPQWVGRRASDAPAHVQDDVAWGLYLRENFGPWPPASRYCRGVA